MEFVLVAILVVAVGAYFALRRVFFGLLRPHRGVWGQYYGRYSDPVSSVWLDRQHFMAERQRKLDASQNVFTRVL